MGLECEGVCGCSIPRPVPCAQPGVGSVVRAGDLEVDRNFSRRAVRDENFRGSLQGVNKPSTFAHATPAFERTAAGSRGHVLAKG